MSFARSTGFVALALLVSLSITAAFAVGLPGGVNEGPDLSAEDTRVPVPVSGAVSQTGTPPAGSSSFPAFEEVSAAIGFDYEPNVPASLEDVNSGVYVVDSNEDGYEDVLAIGERHPVLFTNTGGRFAAFQTFERERVQTAHFFDYDVDGDRDLLLAQYAGRLLFYENVDGRYVRADVGFDRQVTNPTSIVTADLTGNGCLDVFVTQNGLWSGTTPLTLEGAERVRDRHPQVRPDSQSGKPNLLFYGNCEGFVDGTAHAGIRGAHWSLASSAVDFTGDGYPDLHVGNDWSSDYLYVNQGDGTFERRRMGTASDRNAMSSSVADVDGDFDLDLFVTNIFYPENHTRSDRAPPLHRDAAVPAGNNLFVNDGTGNFTDVAPDHGLQKGGWGWTATMADFDNDGRLDVVQTTENVYWVEPYASTYASLQLWTGVGDTWEKLDSTAYGLEQKNTYSIARLDYDNDGDLDLVVGTAPLGPTLRGSAQPFKIYENTHDEGDALQFYVRDPVALDRGAAVYVETDRRVVFERVNSRGNFQTQDSRLVHVGTANETVERVTVQWPDGTERVFTGLESGTRYVLTRSGAVPIL